MSLIEKYKEKLKFINKLRDDGHTFAKIKFREEVLTFNNGKDFLYFDITKRKGRKEFYTIPCKEYISNDWEQQAFSINTSSFTQIMLNLDVYDEIVHPVSRNECIKILSERK